VPFEVTVTAVSDEQDPNGINQFLVNVLHEDGEKWEVKRNAERCRGLLEDFVKSEYITRNDIRDQITAEYLQLLLNQQLKRMGNKIWSEQSFLRFLDSTATQSPLTAAKLQVMERKVCPTLLTLASYDLQPY
jgi:hypothetical protein